MTGCVYDSRPGTLENKEAVVELAIAPCCSASLLYKVFCPLTLVYLLSSRWPLPLLPPSRLLKLYFQGHCDSQQASGLLSAGPRGQGSGDQNNGNGVLAACACQGVASVLFFWTCCFPNPATSSAPVPHPDLGFQAGGLSDSAREAVQTPASPTPVAQPDFSHKPQRLWLN